jgi:uncharacterized protein YciI
MHCSMRRLWTLLALLPALSFGALAQAQSSPTREAAPRDAELARAVGADERGMRPYVLVILKTGPTRVPAGPEREAMFKGHFANMQRLADEGTLAVAGPLDGVDGWRGLFVLAVPDIDTARRHVATDPVVMKGEMVPEFHAFYGSAGLSW